jgi:phosphocarrier protein
LGALERTVRIVNQRGLHARASAKFVKCAEIYKADIRVARGDMSANGRSIMGLMMLAASPGCDVTLSADGADAEAALDALSDLVCRGFDED